MHLGVVGVLGITLIRSFGVAAPANRKGHERPYGPVTNIQLGPRPWYLIDDMDEGSLKDELKSCSEKPSSSSDFSISHRGAPLQFPEHTKESWLAAARMGAGYIECDVAFTKDRQLVCRHSQCVLHKTTNILTVPELAAKCTEPFRPASGDSPASAKCCTSDITLNEFKSLCGKMDGSNTSATTPEEFLHGTLAWRTDLYASKCNTLSSHKEFLSLVRDIGLKFTSELKTPQVAMPFEGDYTQEKYAQQVVDEYKAANIDPSIVYLQSFLIDDVYYWLKADSAFGKRTIYLDDRVDNNYNGAVKSLANLAERGVQIVAPPIFALLTLDDNGNIVPSEYARAAKNAGLKIVTWSLERSGPPGKLHDTDDYYYSSFSKAVNRDGDIYKVIDVLVKRVGVIALFSDWAATVTYYANCFAL